MARPRKQPEPASPELKHAYNPQGSARQLLLCRDREVLMCGAAGTGKTRAALEKLMAMSLATPGMRAVMLRKTMVSLTGTAIVEWRENVAREMIAAGRATRRPAHRPGKAAHGQIVAARKASIG